jgi:uncharacterized protein (TIGR03067 family)
MRMTLTAAVAASFLLGAGAALPAGAEKKGTPELQGTWQAVSFKAADKEMEKERVEKFRMVFKGDRLFMHEGAEEPREYTYKVDAASKPRVLAFTRARGDNPKTVRGIYKVEGDTLTVCINEARDGPLPTEFKVVPENRRVSLVVFKRVKE